MKKPIPIAAATKIRRRPRQYAALYYGMRSRWRPVIAGLLVFILHIVILNALGVIIDFGPHITGIRTIVAITIFGSVCIIFFFPKHITTASMGGGLCGGSVAAYFITRNGSVFRWITSTDSQIADVQRAIASSSVPLKLSGPLVDIAALLIFCMSWISILFLVGLRAYLCAGLAPAVFLLIIPGITTLHAPTKTVVLVGIILCALLVSSNSSRITWRTPLIMALVMGATIAANAVIPRAGERVWNTESISPSPFSSQVPDITVELGRDLRRGGKAVAFSYVGAKPNSSMRFRLATLSDFRDGIWFPESESDPEERTVDIVQNAERTKGASDSVENGGSSSQGENSAAFSVDIEIEGLVSRRLPLIAGAANAVPVTSQSRFQPRTDFATSRWRPEDWVWIKSGTTASSQGKLTQRGDQYRINAQLSLSPSNGADHDSIHSDADSPSRVVGIDVRDLENMDRYRQLPADISPVIGDTARTIAGDGRQARDVGNSLTRWFISEGSFTYDESAPYTPGADAEDPYQTMEAFLRDRHGYCVHFATTFAVMARTLGIPSRVVVGYASRSGGNNGDEFAGGRGFGQVRAENLHAWPELYDAESGWVSFEPTPGGAAALADGIIKQASPTQSASASSSPTQSAMSPLSPSSRQSASSENERNQSEHDEQSGASANGTSSSTKAEGLGGEQESADSVGSTDSQQNKDSPDGEKNSLTITTKMVRVCAATLLLICVLASPALWRIVRRKRRKRRIEKGQYAWQAAWEEFVDSAKDLGLDKGNVVTDPAGDTGRKISVAVPQIFGNPMPRARTPEAFVEFLFAQKILGKDCVADTDTLTAGVARERYGGKEPAGSGMKVESTKTDEVNKNKDNGYADGVNYGANKILERLIRHLRSQVGIGRRMRAALVPSSLLSRRGGIFLRKNDFTVRR